MRNGKFPASHPIGGVSRPGEAELGSDGKLEKFRSLGYWASCFPEGDGITFVPEKEQSNEQVDQDIKDSFGWEIRP